jgi:hypothetical protein
VNEKGDGAATAVDQIPLICAEIKRLLGVIEEQARQLQEEEPDERR